MSSEFMARSKRSQRVLQTNERESQTHFLSELVSESNSIFLLQNSMEPPCFAEYAAIKPLDFIMAFIPAKDAR